jgi:hypothetical protein
MLPSSRDGTLTAMRPIGCGTETSEVIRPAECISIRVVQPPVDWPAKTPICVSCVVTPIVSDFERVAAAAAGSVRPGAEGAQAPMTRIVMVKPTIRRAVPYK